MAVCEESRETPKYIRRSLAEDLVFRDSPSFSGANSNHVVVVMDALRGFSMETLKWALAHVIKPGYLVTLLGVMPWLNLPLSSKIWLDIWTLNLDCLLALRERSHEWKHDSKYQKVRRILELCNCYGVVPHMKVAMGHPLKLVVLEQTTYLHASWVVFDRHHQRDKEFYAKKILCNAVMMNNNGEVDVLNLLRPSISNGDTNTPEASPALEPIVPIVIISKPWMDILKNRDQRKEKSNLDIGDISICGLSIPYLEGGRTSGYQDDAMN